MKKSFALTRSLAVILMLQLLAATAFAQAFTPGDLVLLRVGNGSGALAATATLAFLDEYNTSGALVESIALPTTTIGSQAALTIGGNSVSEGQLALSPNGQYLTLIGYNAAVGSAAPSGVAPGTDNRVVAVVGASGVVDTSTALGTSTMTGNARSAVTDNGTEFWVTTSSGGINYVSSLGASSASQISTVNVRTAGIFNNQLYSSSASGTGTGNGFGLTQIGTGVPTSSTTLSLLPGFLTANTGNSKSPYGIFMAALDLNSDPGILDSAWIADSTSGTGGIQRWNLISGTWTYQYTLGTGAALGVTVNTSGASPIVYATTSAGALDQIVDTGAGSTVNNIATAGTFEAFRGIEFVPVAVPEPTGILAGGLVLLFIGRKFNRRQR